jgi:hypothetical protein
MFIHGNEKIVLDLTFLKMATNHQQIGPVEVIQQLPKRSVLTSPPS